MMIYVFNNIYIYIFVFNNKYLYIFIFVFNNKYIYIYMYLYSIIYFYIIYRHIPTTQPDASVVLLLLDAFQELQSLHQLCWAKLHGSSTRALAPWREAGNLGEGKVSSWRGNGDWCCLVFSAK